VGLSDVPVVVGLSIAPVKSTRLRSVSEIELSRSGVRENRRFFIVDGRDRVVNGKVVGELSAVVADYDDAGRRLALTFPDGEVVSGVVAAGDQAHSRLYSGDLTGRLVLGPWSEALSAFAGVPLRLVEAPDDVGAVDRGVWGTASVISRASLDRLAREGGEPDVDGRRFRMLIEIDGVPAHGEDVWVGHRVRIGEALVLFRGNVGRCLVTSRDPDSGAIDLPTLDLLRDYRSGVRTTEPLPFGIFGEVLEEGVVRVGDTASVQRVTR
jgi:uncharacterized protein YcbX